MSFNELEGISRKKDRILKFVKGRLHTTKLRMHAKGLPPSPPRQIKFAPKLKHLLKLWEELIMELALGSE